MTFELTRIGWPNTAAILCLALFPIVSLATVTGHRSETGRVRQIDTAICCPADSVAIVIADLPGIFLE